MPKIEISDLSVDYKTSHGNIHALENVEFQLEDGESIGIAGESACGKSTLGLSIIRMIQGGNIVSGKITFMGESILDMPESKFDESIRWKEISMIFQGAMNSLDPVFTIQQQFDEVLKQHGFDSNANKIILDVIRAVNLDYSVLEKYPHELSGGMKQRIVIAMALLLKPELIIADEPTTALDVTIQEQILALISELVIEENMALMLITHDLGVVAENTDQMLVMYAGRIVEKGPTNKVFEHLAHPYTRGLFASIPDTEKSTNDLSRHPENPKNSRLSTIPGRVPEFWERTKGCSFADRCSRAQAKCFSELPDETRISNGHSAACFFPWEQNV